MVLLFSSCGLRKKAFQAGFTLWHGKEPCLESRSNERKASGHPVLRTFSGKPETPVTRSYIPNAVSKNEVQTSKKELTAKFNKHAGNKCDKRWLKKSIASKPDKGNKYKLSVTQVNGMALVSLLFLPILILGFLLPVEIGAVVIIAALIIGPVLAAISLAIGYKRRGVWVPGIAAGFWLVILAYLALALFVL